MIRTMIEAKTRRGPGADGESGAEVREALRLSVARALRRARARRSQAEWCTMLAKHLGREIDRSQWSRYEAGITEPPAAVLLAAANAADIPIGVLLSESQPSARDLAAKLDYLLQEVQRIPKPPR